MDRMAREGAHLVNAFVSTSLCSPSRATVLTGQYMHHHRVVDNQRPVPEGTTFFPQYLQRAGYATAFIGKWHMGHDEDDPRPGFDHWVSFRGQGEYFDPLLNINGRQQQFQGYTTDILTDQALAWLRGVRQSGKPFFLYLAHKSVHFPFEPARGTKAAMRPGRSTIPRRWPTRRTTTGRSPAGCGRRRYSIHGIDHMETGAFDKDPVPDFDALYRGYAETVFGLDENLGRLLAYLDQAGLSRNTLVVYMGDNGFELGEHGFYDKRDAFEVSIRVPMLAYAPGLIPPGTRVTEMVQNIDVAATLMEACGVPVPAAAAMDGRSILPLLMGKAAPWRDHILYEYHWEWNFPATPTTFAIRTDRYKFVFYHGVWDDNGFYDLETDPLERHNLIHVPAYRQQVESIQTQLFDELEASGGLLLPVRRPAGERLDQRKLRR